MKEIPNERNVLALYIEEEARIKSMLFSEVTFETYKLLMIQWFV